MASVTIIARRPRVEQQKSCVWTGFWLGGPRKERPKAVSCAPESSLGDARREAARWPPRSRLPGPDVSVTRRRDGTAERMLGGANRLLRRRHLEERRNRLEA